jgi:hypothetical protein
MLSAASMSHGSAITAASGTWSTDAADVRAATAQPVLAVLDQFGVIRANGADATSFLQSQLTNDVQHLAPGHLQMNAYCTPKGRLLAVLDVWRDAEGILLHLPRELVGPVVKRLGMFVLRAKATLADVSQAWSTLAVFGPGATARVAAAGLAPPEAGQAHPHGTTLVARLHDSPRVPERFVILAPAGESEAIVARVSAARRVDAGAWWWSQIDAGVPNVFAATQEKFVPQMINLEVLGGVSFKKGCYPGQEVVARSQYLGKLRRRMAIAHVAGPTCAGADVFAQSSGQAVGTVVMAATAPEGGMDLLFEAPVDQVAGGELRANLPDGPRLDVRRLPYELFDPTA